MCGGDAAFLSNYFDHLLQFMLIRRRGLRELNRQTKTVKSIHEIDSRADKGLTLEQFAFHQKYV